MDKASPIIQLMQFGAVGIIAVVGFYLFFKERRFSKEQARIFLQLQVKDAKSKVRLTNVLENQNQTIEWIAETLDHYITEKRMEGNFKQDKFTLRGKTRRRVSSPTIKRYTIEELDSEILEPTDEHEWDGLNTTDVDKLGK